MDDEPTGGGGGSLSARYLSQPQRLVGCSLPPRVADADAGAITRTRGFVTLAVPHILESAATTQRLPETSLVRFRWSHEASERGSLFQPVRITNAPGILRHRRQTATRRDRGRDVTAGTPTGDWSREGDDDGEEYEDEETKSDTTSARSIEMVYPVCVDAQRFIEYLRDMNEIVLDVSDRTTRRKYGKCVVPLFTHTTSAASSDGNSRSSQNPTTAVEHVLRELRRDNALYEIKSLESDTEDVMIGYLAVKLDIQFRDFGDGNLIDPPVSPHAPVLVPRTSSTVRVNVRQNAVRRRDGEHDEDREFQFGNVSSISYLESDGFHSLQGSSSGSEGMLSSMSSVQRYAEKKTYGANDSPSSQSSMLQHLIEKGKALQQSMAKAAYEEDDWLEHQFPIVTSPSADDDGLHQQDIAANVVSYEDPSDDISDHDPRSWQSILKQAKEQSPTLEIDQNVSHSYRMASTTAARLALASNAQGLKITFEAVKFTSGFIDQLQQLRDSAISSRFSPIEMVVSHSDIDTLLASTTENNAVNQVGRTEPLFTITPSLRKREFRLTYSHAVPLQFLGDRSVLNPHLRSSKKQLQFYVACRSQGTPRRGSRHDKKGQILLHGAVPVCEILDREPTPDSQTVNVSLFVHREDVTAIQQARRLEKAHRVGVLKVTFQLCTMEAEANECEIKDVSNLVHSPPSSRHEWTRQSAGSPIPIRETKIAAPRKILRLSRHDTHGNAASTPKITTQLAVMIDRATSIRSSKTRPLEESFIRCQYTIPPSGSASKTAPPIASFKRSFRRKLRRVTGPEDRAHCDNVGHIGVFSLDVDQLAVQGFKKRLLIIEVWLQGLQHAKDDDGELLGLVKIPFNAFSSCFGEGSSDWEQIIPFVGIDEQLPIEDPFSGQVAGFLQIRVAIGTAEQIIALTSTVPGITRLQAIVKGVLCRKAHAFHRKTKSSRSANEDDQTGESVEERRSQVDSEVESDIIQPNDSSILMQEAELGPSSLLTIASSPNARRLLPATITLSIQVHSITGLMHAIEEQWSQVCTSPSKLELKKHLEGLLTDGVATTILECDFCLGVELEDTAEARSMGRSGTTARLYKKNGLWYNHLRFPATQCAVMNSKQLLQIRSPLQLQVVVHPEVIQIIQDECLDIRILSWCPRSNTEYNIGIVSVPTAAVLFRPSGVQGAFSIAIGEEVLSGRLGVQVQIVRHPDTLSSHQVLHAPLLEMLEQGAMRLLSNRPVSPTSPDEVTTDQSLANQADKYQHTQVTDESCREWQSDGDKDALMTFAAEEDFEGEPEHHELWPLTLHVDQFADITRVSPAVEGAESLASGVQASGLNRQVMGDTEDMFAGEDRVPDDHFSTEDCISVGQASAFTLDETTEYYRPITLSSFGIDEFAMSPLSDSVSPRSPDEELFLTVRTSFGEEELMEDLTLAAVTPRLEEASPGQHVGVEGEHVANEDATDARETVKVSDGYDDSDPELEELGTIGRAFFFPADGEHEDSKNSCTSTAQPDDETRSLGSEYADHGTEISSEDHTGMVVDAATTSPEAVDPGDTDDTIEDERGLGSSAPRSESRKSSAERSTTTSDEKATQVNIESCAVMDKSNQVGLKDDAEEDSTDADHGIHANGEMPQYAEHEDAPEQRHPLQPDHVDRRAATKEMVDVACGTADDIDHLPCYESAEEKDVVQSLHVEANREQLEVNHGAVEHSIPSIGTALNADGELSDPDPGNASCALAQEAQLLQPDQEPSKEPSFTLPADKFELICQLLTEIRDSCGSSLVKEMLQAHSARVTQIEGRNEPISAHDHSVRTQEEHSSIRAHRSNADSLHKLANPTAKTRVDSETIECPRVRQKSLTTSTTEVDRANVNAMSHRDDNADGVREDCELPMVHAPRVDLKSVHWSDSSTLQQEMQRCLKAGVADQISHQSMEDTTVEVDANAHTSPRQCAKLYGDEVDALATPLFAFSSQRVKKPVLFKADSETERIARIMQGSVNYWRKGDEHALTSEDDSVDSFDSDDDDDWCF